MKECELEIHSEKRRPPVTTGGLLFEKFLKTTILSKCINLGCHGRIKSLLAKRTICFYEAVE